MFRYNANTGNVPKLGDFVQVVNSGPEYDGLCGKIGGWTGGGNMIALVAMNKPLPDGSTIVSWPVVCLEEVVVQHFRDVMKQFEIQREPEDNEYNISEFFPDTSTVLTAPRSFLDAFNEQISDMDHITEEVSSVDADGYTIWKGGDYRPVDPDTIVYVKVRGNIPRDPVRAGAWPQICWMHRHKDDDMNKWDIVAYKVVK